MSSGNQDEKTAPKEMKSKASSRAQPQPPHGFPSNAFDFSSMAQLLNEKIPVEKIPLPKSISIRSSGYLKMNPNWSASSPASSPNSQLRVSAPRMVGTGRSSEFNLAEEDDMFIGVAPTVLD